MKPRRRNPPVNRHQAKAAETLPARRKWVFRLVALLMFPALLVALEAGLRLGGCGHSPDFFKRIRIGNEDYLVQNDDFSLGFFPRETARSPGALRMRARKPPGTYRIFILGESAAMGDPEPAYGAGRYLEVLLRDKFPGANFEVINVAFTAINSHVILPIARECAARDGDLWIVYMGNNEMVGPYGAATVFGAQAPPLGYARLAIGIQRTRVGQLLVEGWRKLAGQPAKAPSWGGLQMFLDNRVLPDSPKKEMVYRNFERNLADILHAGLGHGVKIILNTVAVNLKDSPPFASTSATNLPAREQADFADALNQAAQLEGRGEYAAAAGLCQEAAKFGEKSAALQFRWADCLLHLSNYPAAREHFQSACDDDALPFRADSRINAIIRKAADRSSGGNLMLFDAASALAADDPAGVCGYETFYEHVHFDFEGSYRLGVAWAGEVEKMLLPAFSRREGLWASPEQCGQLLGLSDWNRALVIESMISRLRVPPFSGQSHITERVEQLSARVRLLHSRTNAFAAAAARENFARQLERAPEDFILRENFALFLQATGNLPDATAQWRQVRDLIPHDYLPYFQLGRLLGGQGQWAEAEADLRAALRLHPSLTEGWIELGNVLASQQKYSEALAGYSAARRQRPQDEETVLRMGKVYARLNRHDAAIQCYRESAELNPADWNAHFELGGELDSAGKLDEARKEFGEAARLNPEYARAHFNYGVLLAKQGRLDDAQHEFEETIRLEPGYQNARDSLAKIQILKKRQN